MQYNSLLLKFKNLQLWQVQNGVTFVTGMLFQRKNLIG